MKNKPTIFGEESFIIPNIAEQLYHKEMEFRDNVLVGRIACDFNLDKDKVKRQLELCNKLENIDKTDLIDMATRKKFADKDYEIKVLQKALELAVKSYYLIDCISSVLGVDDNQDKISFAVEQLEKVKDYFIEGYAVCKNFSDFYWNFTEQIDNQIEELTHQHEDKGE